MGLFRRKEKALTASGNVVDAIQNNGWNAVPLLGGGARQRILDIYNTAQSANYGWLYSKSPAVRMVIDAIVKAAGELDLRLYEEISESERQARPDHPAALSLRYPNEETPADQWRRGMIKDFLIHDNAYSFLVPAAGGQIYLQRLPAHMLEVQSNNIFRTENYRVWPQGAWTSAGSWGGGGAFVDFDPSQIFHWHGEHPHDLRVGLSHLDTLRGVIAEDAALQQAMVELANAGLMEPTWVFRPGDAPAWSNEARSGFEEDLTNRMRRRTSKPIVMEEGMEMRSFGVSPRDAQMMDVRRWAVSIIASEYDLPLSKAGLAPATQEDEDAFIADVLSPLCKNFASFADLRILVRVYNETEFCFEFNLDERQMGNDRIRTLVTASGRPVYLTNEARAKLNLPPVDGGDELITPLNVIEGDNPRPAPAVMPVQDPNAPAQDGSYRSGQGSASTAPKALTKSEPLPQLVPRRKAEIDRQHHNIDAMQGVVQRHFNRLERSLRAKAATDWVRWDREFSDDLDKALTRIVAAEGGIYTMKLAGGNFDLARVRNYLKAMAEGAAGAINDTVRGEITSLGLDDAMARAPQHVASAGSSLGSRATLWARDEAARQSPDYEQRVKSWIADTDRHAEWDGTTVAVGDDWPAGFAPGSAPGCQCSASIT